ncbi:hypothetical protein SP19_151 [Salmonella phage 19]|nr:hypothetical protein SP19_151 [Salmonella phage 19]
MDFLDWTSPLLKVKADLLQLKKRSGDEVVLGLVTLALVSHTLWKTS